MRNNGTTIALSAGLGFVTGMRSMAGLAFMSRHFSQHSLAARRLGQVSSLLRSKRISGLMNTLAAGEMAADKMPAMPDRTQAAPLIGRAAFGAFAGMAVAEYRGAPRISAAVAGGLAAVGSTVLFYHLRGWAADKLNLPDWVVALVEDALVLTAGRQLAAELDA